MIVEVHAMTEMSDFLVPLKAQFNMKKKKHVHGTKITLAFIFFYFSFISLRFNGIPFFTTAHTYSF